eukprot:2959178-Rhodomonas_salina.2
MHTPYAMRHTPHQPQATSAPGVTLQGAVAHLVDVDLNLVRVFARLPHPRSHVTCPRHVPYHVRSSCGPRTPAHRTPSTQDTHTHSTLHAHPCIRAAFKLVTRARVLWTVDGGRPAGGCGGCDRG